jgi:hypothetical protein
MKVGFQQMFVGTLVFGLIVPGSIAGAQHAPAPSGPVLTLKGDAAVVTVLIKPDKTADFEFVLAKLKSALEQSSNPERQRQAAGWKVFKTLEPAQGNTVYVMRIDPVVQGAEYDITRLIAEAFPNEVQDIFQKYKDSFAGRAITEMTMFMKMRESATAAEAQVATNPRAQR